ncbi:MAG: OmpA family protein, partial [Acidobacteriaceae bacterium]
VVPLAATLIVPAAFGQQNNAPASSSQNTPSQSQSQPSSQAATSNEAQTPAGNSNSQYATGAPLAGQSKEGFWGHLMPFARKKYVQRNMDPVRGRVNELDELTARNASSIKDVDSRAQQGIKEANARAGQADQHAMAANQLATQANSTAQQATTRLATVQHTVSNLDQYQPVTDAEIRFKPGQTKLGAPAQQALDQIADQLKGHSGYILQVQGFSTSKGTRGIENSQAITQSVVRYLVEQHDVPLYRIYTIGMGNAEVKATAPEAAQPATTTAAAAPARKFRGGKVEVSLLKNSLADMSAQNGTPQ